MSRDSLLNHAQRVVAVVSLLIAKWHEIQQYPCFTDSTGRPSYP